MLFSIKQQQQQQQQQLNVFSQSEIIDFLYLLLAICHACIGIFNQFDSVCNDIYNHVRNNFLMTSLIIIVLLQININYHKYNNLCQQCLFQWHSLAFLQTVYCCACHPSTASTD